MSLSAVLFLLAAIGEARADGPAVVELFTSQGCYSCPPAERYLGKLAKQKDVLALEFHVDYWDDLIYGAAGKWKDPFSDRDYTRRQVDYNRRIRGKSGVYTPQMVIGGRHEAVGFRRHDVERAIDAVVGTMPVQVDISAIGEAGISVHLSGETDQPAKVWLVRYIREAVTRVSAGENKGETLVNHNIVSNMRPVGTWKGRTMTVRLENLELESGEGCAVLVQDEPPGPILGAGSCPEPLS